MGCVEGVTEFLPISSTGHLILFGELLGFLDGSQRAVYEVFIQLGAVCAVIWNYRQKFWQTCADTLTGGPQRNLMVCISIAFIPSIILGVFLGEVIKESLFTPNVVATAFILGGLIILWAESRPHTAVVTVVDSISKRQALLIGLAQCFALIPGTSRSGATIIGGLFAGLSRKASTEFSFFLGIPTLGAASLYSLYNARNIIGADDVVVFAVGLIVSFATALMTIRLFLQYISSHSFAIFAWYRIGFGLLVILTDWTGLIQWSEP